MNYVRFLLIFATLLGVFKQLKTQAQDRPADAPIEKSYTDFTPFAGIKGEYFYKQNSCIYYSFDYNFNKDYRYRVTNSTRFYNRIGAEINAGGRWYVGAAITHRYAYYNPLSMATAKINFSHRGKIGSIQLIKELSVEYIHHFNSTFFNQNRDIQAGIGAGIYKDFNVAKHPLGLLLSYKVILNSALQADIYKYRKIDFTRLRIDITYGMTDNIYIGIFAMKETEYFYPPGTSAGTPPVNIYYKINSITPLTGVNVTILLHPEKMEKYIPGLPFR